MCVATVLHVLLVVGSYSILVHVVLRLAICIVCFVTERPKLLGRLDVLLGVPITVTLVSVAVVENGYHLYMCV